ncbi:MAG TPA: choice-of-anchor tandem repeat GloVer-containing protein [Candidatus Acidoferrales bacterium]|jgi:uncharacterized repeat protein (TIGR03803 family)|nr:choice-of-anchor tandem repeat GloVer-containing protein [Candidatus Acidoferrales bacterium]
MKNMLNLPYSVLGVCAAALLVACSGASQSGLGAPALVPSDARAAIPLSVRYSVLHSFKGGFADGEEPFAGLVNVKGTLYGTTYEGGAYNRIGEGTVFSITPSGTETVLHSFGGSQDGAYPVAGLINVKGTLYGTTGKGGANGDGTVFSITPSGTETVLYSFKGGPGDGEQPRAGLINVKGTLYGTTYLGGNCSSSGGCGTVFSMTPSGTETMLYSFKGVSGDGKYPFAGLIDVKGKFYGTTFEGGANCSGSGGCGTVFSITRSGEETMLHSFAGDPDGNNPEAGLINVKGTLYSTTYAGGTNNRGTVFSITPSGTETVLHSFGGSGDGADPVAALLYAKGKLYSTTFVGGPNNDGTVFSITPSGTQTVLYSFKGGGSGDGESPRAGLVKVKSALYGTTGGGGTGCGGSYGCGTVYSLSQF